LNENYKPHIASQNKMYVANRNDLDLLLLCVLLLCTLFTIYSPPFFDKGSYHLHGDVLIKAIQSAQIWLAVSTTLPYDSN